MTTPNNNGHAAEVVRQIEMATAASESEALCSLQPPPSPSPQGIFRPTISSTRRSSRAPSAHVGGVALNFRVPSLPKLHRKGPLVSTKLCETVSRLIKMICVFNLILNRGENLTLGMCLTCPILMTTTNFWSTTVCMILI